MRSDRPGGRLRAALRGEAPAFGLFVVTPAPQIVELIGLVGFDFIVIDLEHSLINPESLEHMLRAGDLVNLPTIVRVPALDSGLIAPALDAGAAGILVPRIRTAAQARATVSACRYAPHDDDNSPRGLAAGRAALYGTVDLAAFVATADREVLVGIMIEDQEGVDAIEEIVAVPGIDFVVEGAADLSRSLGFPWQTRHERVRLALQRVQGAASARHLPFCAVPRLVEDTDEWWRRGVRLFLLGDDRGIARRALLASLEESRRRCPGPKD